MLFRVLFSFVFTAINLFGQFSKYWVYLTSALLLETERLLSFLSPFGPKYYSSRISLSKVHLQRITQCRRICQLAYDSIKSTFSFWHFMVQSWARALIFISAKQKQYFFLPELFWELGKKSANYSVGPWYMCTIIFLYIALLHVLILLLKNSYNCFMGFLQ